MTNLRYKDVREGKVRFVADGRKAMEQPSYIDFRLKPVGEKCPEVFPYLVLKVNVLIVLETPKNEEIKYITATPTMPSIKCKAKLSGKDLMGNYLAHWECQVKYEYPPGSAERNYTEEKFFDSNLISEWDLNFNNSEIIIGGEAKIIVSTTIEGKVYSDSVRFHIRGQNPADAEVLHGLDRGEIAMLRTESTNLDQFDTENYAVPR